MRWTSIVAIYFVTWFLVLFAVLPFGVRTQEEEGDTVLGTPPSAPARPRLVKIAAITSIVAGVIVGLFWFAYVRLGFDTAWLARAVW